MEEKDRKRDNEVFTNNLDIPYAEQCKNCRYRLKTKIEGDLCPPYKKLKCGVYQTKPLGVINNKEKCKFYTKEK